MVGGWWLVVGGWWLMVGGWWLGIYQLAKQRQGQRCERLCFAARLTDGDPRAMVNEQACSGTRTRYGHAHLQSAVCGRAPQRIGNRSRLAEQTRQAAQIQRDLTPTTDLDARRELARHTLENGLIRPLCCIQRTEHASSPRATKARKHQSIVVGHSCHAGCSVYPPARRHNPNLCCKAGHPVGRRTAPCHLPGAHHRQTARAARQRLRRHQQARGVAPLDDALQPQPGGKRQALQYARIHIREINGDNREPACLQNEVERLDGAIDDTIGGAHLPANPQQTLEVDACGRCAGNVESIASVDERGDLARARRCRHQLKKERGATRGGSAGNLGYLPARQSAMEHGIDRLDAGRNERARRRSLERRKGARQGAIKLSFPECGFKDRQRMVRHIFANGEYRRM